MSGSVDVSRPHLIGHSTFEGCSSLTKFTLPFGMTTLCHGAFEGCTSLTDVALPLALTDIGDVAFRGCTSLSKLNLPAPLTAIGCGAFEGCSSLKELTLPYDNTFTTIGADAFRGCTSLSHHTLPTARLTIIGDGTFPGSTLSFQDGQAAPAARAGTSLWRQLRAEQDVACSIS